MFELTQFELKKIKYKIWRQNMIMRILTGLFITAALILTFGCERDVSTLEPATYPAFSEVFLDEFVPGLDYSAFGNSKLDAFEIDDEETFEGSSSIKITVPGENDPSGWYAGGTFYSTFPRDLSGYNALTFWGKASKTTVAEVGFGNDNAGNLLYSASQSDILFGTSWQKYIIPIPLPEKLTAETGMFWYSAGADENGLGSIIWFDEVKYENLGTIAYPRIILEDTLLTGAIGGVLDVGINGVRFNVDGVDKIVNAGSAYFTLMSLNESVATVTADGKINGIATGTTKIVVKLGSVAQDTITVQIGEEFGPTEPAVTPTIAADSVISLFSNAYTDHPGVVWNTFWEFSNAQTEDIQVAGNDVKLYTDLNFVGIEFTSPTVNASDMTHFHIDIWTPDPTAAPATFKILLTDFGANGVFDGGDDSSHELTFTASTTPALATQQWISFDIPLSDFSGLTSTEHLAQLVLSGDIPTVFVDNVYFYNAGTGGEPPTEPATPAPTPSYATGDVVSVFSDAYTDLAGTDFFPNWGQATVVTQPLIQGNATLLYSGLNYQGIQLQNSQDVSGAGMAYLHVDFWTANSTALNVYLISTGPVEKAYALTVPTTGWTSVDIPLNEFSPVDLSDIIQLKFDGNGDIYLDNIFWHK